MGWYIVTKDGLTELPACKHCGEPLQLGDHYYILAVAEGKISAASHSRCQWEAGDKK